MKVVFSCTLLCLSVVLVNATVLFSDSFNYPDGAITNVAAGIWIEHSGGGVCQVASGQAQVMSTVGQDVHVTLTNQPFTTGSGVTLYASFTVKFTAFPNAAGTYFAHFNGASSHRCLVWTSIANAAAGTYRLGVGNTTGANNASGQVAVNLSLNTAYFVVARYNTGTGVSTIWLNPTAESDASVTASDTPTAISISNFSLRQNSGMGTLLMDDLRIGTNFFDVVTNSTPPPAVPPNITTQPQNQIATAGDPVSFMVVSGGTSPLSYQWRSNNVAVVGATNDTFTLFNVTTNLSGSSFFVTITNAAGSTNSVTATLTVNPLTSAFTYLTYNLHGNSQTNWTTNSLQIMAIGRQLAYLRPDVVTFNEIPYDYTNEMHGWIAIFLPGYSFVISPGGDGFIHSGVASRFPIARSQKWLDFASLTNFGFNGHVARDLFEAQLTVPNFPQPFHVFVAHLKATLFPPQEDADQRAAEASCVSNFFVNTFLAGTNRLHPYILSGDMNEDVLRPDSDYISGQPIQRLTSLPTGLRLTTPVNPFDNSSSNDMTVSIQATRLSARFDYIMPSTLLFSNITTGQVFRTDKLIPVPPTLNSNDDKIASDHLPVLMTFNNPYDKPFRITTITRTNPGVNLTWESIPGQPYRVQISSNLTAWSSLATNLVATNYNFTFTTNNVPGGMKFFRIYRGW